LPKINLSDELRRIAKGEVLSDLWSRKIYSVDASHYTISPDIIVSVKETEEISEICKSASYSNTPITARGAGTGLLGQCLNTGISLDFTKHMNKIIELEDNYVVVQPGIVKAVLDKELKKRNKIFPVDPASSNYCTVGGMIANNSSGIHALGYGSKIDFLEQIEVVYSDGIINLLSSSQINILPNNQEYERIRKLKILLSKKVLDVIKLKYPKVTKNSCGYRLDSIKNNKVFHPQKLFAASESTLGIFTLARFRILDLPLYRHTLVMGFSDVLQTVKHVPRILKYLPSALELLDGSIFSCEKKIMEAKPSIIDTAVSGGCLLFVEFTGNNQANIDRKFSKCKKELAEYAEVIETSFDTLSSEHIWNSRKNALNNIMKMTIGSRKPVGLIEDTVVDVNDLFEYMKFLLLQYKKYKMTYFLYGHAGNGNIHTRPLIDVQDPLEIEKLRNLADKVFSKVFSLSGSISAEHGDGLGRVDYISKMYGFKINNLFKTIKTMFDPKNIMNPGKKIPYL
jgi:FAD/FMN-containing dehydrogenase